MTMNRDGLISVSYTHLDVYKRQHRWCCTSVCIVNAYDDGHRHLHQSKSVSHMGFTLFTRENILNFFYL